MSDQYIAINKIEESINASATPPNVSPVLTEYTLLKVGGPIENTSRTTNSKQEGEEKNDIEGRNILSQ